MKLFKKLFARTLSRRASSRQETISHRLTIEALESRQLLAVNVTFFNGTLSVVGDDNPNVIDLARQANGNLVVTADSPLTTLGGIPNVSNTFTIVIEGRGGNDTITMQEGGGILPAVTIDGGNGNDTIRGTSSNDFIFGGTGSDFLLGLNGNDFISGGEGSDEIRGGLGTDLLMGGIDNDIVQGGADDDTIQGEAGNDDLRGDAGNDVLHGGPGDDQMQGLDGNDILRGDDGNDGLDGNAGDDILEGGLGNDRHQGHDGNDNARGGQGNDVYLFDADNALGFDILFESAGEGADRLSFTETTTTGITVDLGTSSVQQVTPGTSFVLSDPNTFENGTGGAGADTFIGNAQVNRYAGAGGKDTFAHRGTGGGIDLPTDFTPVDQDEVFFMTGGTLSADQMTIDATARILRDAATGTIGFDFPVPVLVVNGPYKFGRTDTVAGGQLFTFTGTGGLGLGFNADALVATYSGSGKTLGGAGLGQRLIDHSANGNTLIGRDGDDIIEAGAGNDILDGGEGFAAGGNDILTGGLGDDTFRFGTQFASGTPIQFGDDTITDFNPANDIVDLVTGLSVRSGLGTSTVTIWNGTTNFGTIRALKNYLWQASDFI
jgi:Ca2+-binding RTX toxin-like protein